MRARAAVVAAGLTFAAALGSAGVANADPRNGGSVTLTCDGQTFQAVLFSNGEWSPALASDSNAVLVPLIIGPSHVVVTDAEGNVIEESDEPASTKGNAAQAHGDSATTCTFVIDGTDDGVTFHIEGTVVGLLTPANG